MLSRRRLLSAMAAAPALWSVSGTRSLAKERMHEAILKHAKRAAAGWSGPLKLLYPKGCIDNIRPVAAAFEAHTGVTLAFTETGVDDINTQILLETAKSGTSFDLALPATFGIPELVEEGALQNLDALAQEFEPPDYQATSLFTIGDYYKGSLYGYQTDGDTYLAFYNRPWLEDAENQRRFADQFERPLAVPETWEQLDQIMQFFYSPDQGQYGGCLYRTPSYAAWEWWIRFHAKGFFPVTDELSPQINNEAGVAALTEMLAATAYQHPSATVDGLFANWQAYGEGAAFANLGWGGTQKYLNGPESALRGRLAHAPTPGGMIGDQLLKTPYFNWGWNYVVSSRSKRQQLAYLFALYACAPEPSTLAVREAGGYFDPFRPEHYEDAVISKTYSPEFLDAHRASMAESIPDFYLKGQGAYLDVLRESIGLAQSAALSPQRALDLAAQEWEGITNRMGREGQIEQWQFLKSQYPQRARSLLS